MCDLFARIDTDPALLKANPYLLHRAMERLITTPDQCVRIGDSVADIQAAHAAGVAAIAYANKSEKSPRLVERGPAAVVDCLLTTAMAPAPSDE
ncbi:HAD hydrolase-like protein [Haloechinothrix halophila]|uniref:HAD hydrolase-like protein n=1 Tax=Haloechinothrix halophila TaxID=1069073 RepID=UPI0006870005